MNVMDVILDIESKARAISKESDEICAEQREAQKEETDTFKESIRRSAEMKIAGFAAEQDKKAAKRLEELAADYGQKTAELDEKYAANKEKWIADIIKRAVE